MTSTHQTTNTFTYSIQLSFFAFFVFAFWFCFFLFVFTFCFFVLLFLLFFFIYFLFFFFTLFYFFIRYIQQILFKSSFNCKNSHNSHNHINKSIRFANSFRIKLPFLSWIFAANNYRSCCNKLLVMKRGKKPFCPLFMNLRSIDMCTYKYHNL